MRDEVKEAIIKRYGKDEGQTIVSFFQVLEIQNVYFINGKASFQYAEEDVDRFKELLKSDPHYGIFSLIVLDDVVFVEMHSPKLIRSQIGRFLDRDSFLVTFRFRLVDQLWQH